MRKFRLALVALAGVLALGVAACGGSDSSSSGGSSGGGSGTQLSGTINGAGATFPQPVYQEWAARFQETMGPTVNYQGIGSGGGIAQFTAGTVDFGATDAAMTDEEIKSAQAKGEPVHVPTVLGAVTVSYNLQGVEVRPQARRRRRSRTSSSARSRRGTTRRSRSSTRASSLPSGNITVCHRSDESGTTKNFTAFLVDYSKAWAAGPGSDKSVKWPTGTGAKGNDGVAACIKQNDGAVGYVEQAYALANNFTFAERQEQVGQLRRADARVHLGGRRRASRSRATSASRRSTRPGKDAYPITALTFLLVYDDMCKAGLSADKAMDVKAWLQYGQTQGQGVAKQLQYAPLPGELKTKTAAKVDALVCNGKPIKVPAT